MQLIKIFLFLITLNSPIKDKKIEDKFFAEDKLKHFSLCFFLTNIIYQEARYDLKMKEKESIYLGISVPLGIGIFKEFYDKKNHGLFSLKDVFWDITGVVSAFFLIYFY